MIDQSVLNAFNLTNQCDIQTFSSGLINASYRILLPSGKSFFLQKINQTVFHHPSRIQQNYQLISTHFTQKQSFHLPFIIKTNTGELLFSIGEESWRCFEFLKNTYSPSAVQSPDKAYEVAYCFGTFTAQLKDLKVETLSTILPRFHDLTFRYEQLEQALAGATNERKTAAATLLKEVFDNQYLLHWYNKISADKKGYPLHILHHDCKIANILFEKETDKLLCPIDLDTTQPGLFFSDIGDMIRTITPNMSENDIDIENLEIRKDFYDATIKGYSDAMGAYLTQEEKNDLHYAGPVLIYMQAIRFLADYLNGNIYYRVDYYLQNKDRAANQMRLLKLLNHRESIHLQMIA